MKCFLYTLPLAALIVLLPGCAYYSFTGATIPEHLETVAIPQVEDNSAGSLTTLSEDLTRLLIDRFVRQTRLRLQPSEDEASAVLTATIDRYENTPAAVSANESAELNRVTVSVTVRYFDRVENKELLQRSFYAYGEYNPSVTGLEGEAAAARVALNSIANDIFSAATSNW